MPQSTDNTEKLLEALTSKIDTLGQDLKQELSLIKQDVNDLKVQTGRLEEKMLGIDTRLKTVETGMIPLAEKVGELKNWRQIAIIIITGTVGTIFGWFVRGGKI